MTSNPIISKIQREHSSLLFLESCQDFVLISTIASLSEIERVGQMEWSITIDTKSYLNQGKVSRFLSRCFIYNYLFAFLLISLWIGCRYIRTGDDHLQTRRREKRAGLFMNYENESDECQWGRISEIATIGCQAPRKLKIADFMIVYMIMQI